MHHLNSCLFLYSVSCFMISPRADEPKMLKSGVFLMTKCNLRFKNVKNRSSPPEPLSISALLTHCKEVRSVMLTGLPGCHSCEAVTAALLHTTCSPCWSRWWQRPLCHMASPPQRCWANTDECRPPPSPHSPSPQCTPSSACQSWQGEHSGKCQNTGEDF